MHINHASIAFTQFMRMRGLMTFPPLPIERIPLSAELAAASGDRPSLRLPHEPRGSAVEAGRPATPRNSDPGKDCDCPTCRSDCARILPCQRKDH